MLSRLASLVALFVLCSLATGQSPVRLGNDGFRIGQPFQEAVQSLDGKYFALAGVHPDCFLLDAATGTVLQHWEMDQRVGSLAFAPDGTVLALDETGYVHSFDPISGRKLRSILLHPGKAGLPVQGSLFEGGRLAAFPGDKPELSAMVLYDLRTGRLLPRESKRQPLMRCGSRDGRFLLEAGELPSPSGAAGPLYLDILDLDTGQLRHVPKLPLKGVQGIAYDEKYQVVVVVGEGLAVWVSPATGAVEKRELAGMYPNWIQGALVFAPDASRVVLSLWSNAEGKLAEWDLITGKLIREWKVSVRPLNRVAWTPAGGLLAWLNHGERLQPRNLRNDQTPPASGHMAAVHSVSFTAGGRELLSTDVTGRTCRWNVSTGRLLDDLNLPPKSSVALPTGMPWVPTTADLRWWGKRDRTGLHDCNTNQSVNVPESVSTWLTAAPNAALWAASTDSGKRVAIGVTAAGGDPGKVALQFAVLPGEDLRQRWAVAVKEPSLPVFSPEGSILALCHDDKLTLFEAGHRKQTVPLPGARAALAFSPDARHLLIQATGSEEYEFRLVELKTQAVRQRWVSRGLLGIHAVFSPDGKRIAVPASDGTIAVLPVNLPPLPAPAPTPDTFWRDLASRDLLGMAETLQSLAGKPETARQLLRRLDAPDAPARRPDARLLADLDADDPAIREAAQAQLRSFSRDTLSEMLASAPAASAEVRRALRDALEQLQQARDLHEDDLRRLRLTGLLERLPRDK
jgi:WD40 repeat protein